MEERRSTIRCFRQNLLLSILISCCISLYLNIALSFLDLLYISQLIITNIEDAIFASFCIRALIVLDVLSRNIVMAARRCGGTLIVGACRSTISQVGDEPLVFGVSGKKNGLEGELQAVWGVTWQRVQFWV